jgi:SAM-dependent methyltransferase
MMWWRTIRPRLLHHLPAEAVLEIAPGYGRWTSFLLNECTRLVGIDVTARCVEVCRQRFPESRAAFYVNDGQTLPMVAPASIDLAFSVDSLVHVEAPQVESYLQELARVLRPGGAAFLHHSNLGAYADGAGAIPAWVGERHWRAPSMSAALFRSASRHAGLRCVSQEVINWIGRDADVDRFRLPTRHIALTDCFSMCVRPVAQDEAPTRVLVNRHFVDEWRGMIALTATYGDANPRLDEQGAGSTRPSGRRLHAIAAAARQRWRGRRFFAREPIVRTLASGACPDCQGRVVVEGPVRSCRHCDAQFTIR